MYPISESTSVPLPESFLQSTHMHLQKGFCFDFRVEEIQRQLWESKHWQKLGQMLVACTGWLFPNPSLKKHIRNTYTVFFFSSNSKKAHFFLFSSYEQKLEQIVFRYLHLVCAEKVFDHWLRNSAKRIALQLQLSKMRFRIRDTLMYNVARWGSNKRKQ